MNQIILEIGTYQLTLARAILAGLFVILWFFLFFRGLDRISKILSLDKFKDTSIFHRLSAWVLHILFIILLVEVLNLNYVLFESHDYTVNIINILLALLIVQIARSLDWVGQHLLTDTSQSQSSYVNEKKTSGSRLVQTILIVFALWLLIENFHLDVGFPAPIGENEELTIYISNLILVILTLLIARLVVWLVTKVFLPGFYISRQADKGVRFAFNQLVAYVVYTVAILIAFQNLGINMNLIWGGGAALLVGIGLGLQQTFADFFAGIILLFERSVKIGDVLEVDNMKGVVRKIGLRTSVVQTIEHQSIVIPNSHLTNHKVINWTHLNNEMRFVVSVGVEYGSDTKLVRNLLLKAVEDNPSLLKKPSPFVRFEAFGDSSLDFAVYFYCMRLLTIENIKSDIRFEIDRLFREHNVTIPFPQRDVWVKGDG